MQAASTSYRAYALDLWGFGDTAKSADNYNIDKQTELLESFLNELGVGKVALVGHGLGAIVAMQFIAKQSFAVDRMMIVGVPINFEDLDDKLKQSSPLELANWLLKQSAETETARAEAPKSDEQAIKISLEDLKNINTSDFIKQNTTASLLVHGQNDPMIKTPSLDGNGNLSRQMHHIIFEESGHFPMIDESNKFNRLLADFLALEPGESPRQLQLKEEWKRRVR